MRGKVCPRINTGIPIGITPAYAGKRELGEVQGYTEKRITPAYAGKSLAPTKEHHPLWDHPRLCGEKLIIKIPDTDEAGSPPPMRGKGTSRIASKLILRITPAYAGKSQHRERDSGKSEDHPRLCGEKAPIHTDTPYFSGSPPPMRGKAAALDTPQRRERITPAYAGKRNEVVAMGLFD